MKKYGILLLVWAACTPYEEPPFIPVEMRETVEFLNQELVEFWLYQPEKFHDTLYLTLKRRNQPEDEFLRITDSLLVSKFIEEVGWTYGNEPFPGNIRDYFGWFHQGQETLKVLVSGQVKASDPRDSLPNPPFILEKIEQSPPCPLVISPIEITYPLQNIKWKWIGFVDESGQVYSHPTCENPIGTIEFTTQTFRIPGFFVPYYPEAMAIGFNLGIYPPFKNPPYYEVSPQKLTFHNTIYYGPNRHPMGGNTTKRTYAKYDSIMKLMEPGVSEYQIQGNRLVISRQDLKLRALFMAD